ncbi:Uncharacterised protein [Mycobacteroides abscessus subsp. abscessus]|nr:Uncharacterised protein [Mycobacteroides abscessus]SHV19042.1 Uncharacterised protein [Mycobacteroides abscessus subsp. abscessus]
MSLRGGSWLTIGPITGLLNTPSSALARPLRTLAPGMVVGSGRSTNPCPGILIAGMTPGTAVGSGVLARFRNTSGRSPILVRLEWVRLVPKVGSSPPEPWASGFQTPPAAVPIALVPDK